MNPNQPYFPVLLCPHPWPCDLTLSKKKGGGDKEQERKEQEEEE